MRLLSRKMFIFPKKKNKTLIFQIHYFWGQNFRQTKKNSIILRELDKKPKFGKKTIFCKIERVFKKEI